MYKEKLIVLLKSLECQNIEELIEESPENLKAIGIEITKYAKIGVEAVKAMDKILWMRF